MIIGRGRHREHPQPTLFTTTTGVAQLPVAHTQGNPGSSDLRSHPVAMVLLLRKKRRTGHVTDVTSCQKALLGRIWRNFRLRMRRTYFQIGHLTDVTSGHVTDVTSGHVASGHVISGCTPSNAN
jgi:hypothetical protein